MRISGWFFFVILHVVHCGEHVEELNIKQIKGNYSEVMTFNFNQSSEYVIDFPTSRLVHPYTIQAWSENATVEAPVLVVVRRKRQVLSWEIPLKVATSSRNASVHFYNTSRTLCHNMPKHAKNKTYNNDVKKHLAKHFFVLLSTSSLFNIDVSVIVFEEQSFSLKEGKEYNISVSPSQPKYYYYQFPPENEATDAIIKINSDDDVCLTVSVQDSVCPVYDLDKDITYEGQYQTVDLKGAMSISKLDFPIGFFLVFVAKADNYECVKKDNLFPYYHETIKMATENRTSTVRFSVKSSVKANYYIMPILITLGSIAAFSLIAIFLFWAFTTWGTLSKHRPEDQNDANADTKVSSDFEETKKVLLESKNITVHKLTKIPKRNDKKSYNYSWHILNIAIFYIIPVAQLVITYQRVVNTTGNQDMCYYNFLCANPIHGVINDFNHIFSNVGYVCMGLLFLGMVWYRRYKIPTSKTGVPVHYDTYFAMGAALISEGVLSACYHICPNKSNFQFGITDTSFMYVMAVLCLIKVYQNRHPEVTASAYATFSVFGIMLILATVGILHGNLIVFIFFGLIYILLCIFISFKIYYLSFVIDGLKIFISKLNGTEGKIIAIAPVKKIRFGLLVTANIINYGMLIGGLFLYNYNVSDFGTFLLIILMGNAVLYAILYTLMKLLHKEKLCLQALIYGLLAIAAWIISAFFFFDNATAWTDTPAQSRELNQECVFLNFYDKHDIWHLLSAPALYLTFMFLLCLDDDLIEKSRENIAVF